METIEQHLSKIDKRLDHMEKMLSILVRAKNKEIKKNSQPEWVSEEETLKMLGISKKYLRAQVRKGDLPILYKKRNSHHYQYERASLNRVLNEY